MKCFLDLWARKSFYLCGPLVIEKQKKESRNFYTKRGSFCIIALKYKKQGKGTSFQTKKNVLKHGKHFLRANRWFFQMF